MTEETMNELIQSLLDALADGQRYGVRLSPEILEEYHAALTALVSEVHDLRSAVREMRGGA